LNGRLSIAALDSRKSGVRPLRSSIARRLGMDIGGLELVDRNVEGVVEMMLDATQHYGAPLTACSAGMPLSSQRLAVACIGSLLPTGATGNRRTDAGDLRSDGAGKSSL
jgi:hypothetical protein